MRAGRPAPSGDAGRLDLVERSVLGGRGACGIMRGEEVSSCLHHGSGRCAVCEWG
jgi:hypothetical protein